MQTDTTSTATDATDTTTITADPTEGDAPTIVQLIAEQNARFEREAEARRLEEESKVQAWMRKEQNHISTCITETMPADLRNALAPFTIRWIENTDGLYTPTGTHPVAMFTYNGEEWAIDTCNGLSIRGPNGYREYMSWYDLHVDVLLALQCYPEWLAKKEAETQRERERQRELAEQEAQRTAPSEAQENAQIHYTNTEGGNPRTALLHRGAYVTLWFPPYANGEGSATWGVVEAADENWLLVTLDNGKQQLIARRHVVTIEPRERPARQPELAQDEQATRYNADLMSDEIPF